MYNVDSNFNVMGSGLFDHNYQYTPECSFNVIIIKYNYWILIMHTTSKIKPTLCGVCFAEVLYSTVLFLSPT